VNGANNVVALLSNSISVFGEMDIISVFETEGGSSILSRPAKLNESGVSKIG
jgi:hypothetical protein